MKNFFALLLVTTFAVTGLSQEAKALVDLRLNYGLLVSNTDLNPLCPTCSGAAPSIVPTYGLGADVVVNLPIPFVPGFGLRYEDMGLTASGNGVDFKEKYTRTSLLVNYHLLDNFVYLGPVVTYGLSHSVSLKAAESGRILVAVRKPASVLVLKVESI